MGWRQAANPFAIAQVRGVRPTSAQSLPFAVPLGRSALADPAIATTSWATTALALSVLRPPAAPLLQRLRVRVEHILMLLRERRTDLGALALHQRLELLPITSRSVPRRFHRCAVALLPSRPH